MSQPAEPQDDVRALLAAARQAAGAEDAAPLAWRRVERADGQPWYLLVGVGSGYSGRVVAVGQDAEVRVMASDPAGANAWWVDAEGDLVWAPGSSSRSPLYPLRRVGVGGEVVYRDVDGAVVPLWAAGRG
ncbi:hypothetical protein [Microbacterium candidum]|uniref:Uncharacterized protein n=1 Tax=Microbacterium candidum TaxID=3041922 RepID=A0ABT7MVQ5_9MICO|nr:hypothetical protein [Microbacterium sp. ASV49]MDL9978531.1 hypothetical protein [Microbacterium sp. ASV49]